MKRIWLILLPLIVSFSLVAAIYFSIKPTIRSWAQVKLEQILSQELGFDVQIKTLNFSLLWPKIWIEDLAISVGPQSHSFKESGVEKLEAEELSAHLDPFSILLGRFSFASFEARGLKTTFQVDPWLESSSKEKMALPVAQLFQWLKKIPISQVGALDSSVIFNSQKLKSSYVLSQTQLLLSNRKTSLDLELRVQDGSYRSASEQELPFKIESSMTLTPRFLELKILDIESLKSRIRSSGQWTNITHLLSSPEGRMRLEANLDMDSLAPALFPADFKFSPKGNYSLESDLVFTNKNFEGSKARIYTQKAFVGPFYVGDLDAQIQFKNSGLTIPSIKLTSPAGLIDISDLNINFQPEPNLKGLALNTQFLDLNQLVQQLGVGDIPVEAFASGTVECSGPLKPLQVECLSDLSLDEFEVRSGSGKKAGRIISVENLNSKARAKIDSRQIDIESDLTISQSIGSAKGKIEFKNGFHFEYQSPNLRFLDLRSLAELDLEGEVAVIGSTSGDSKSAEFSMDLKGKSAVLENFVLGDLDTRLSYRKGQLEFKSINTVIQDSQIKGEFGVDLTKTPTRISGDFFSEKLRLKDLFFAIERVIKIPIAADGFGQAVVRFSGPARLSELDSEISAEFSQGLLGNEDFNRFNLAATSSAGKLSFQKAELIKGRGRIEASGGISKTGALDIQLKGRQLQLEESTNISSLNENLSGLVQFDSKILGPINSPRLEIELLLSQLRAGERDFRDSRADLRFSQSTISGQIDLFGSELKTEFNWPLIDSESFSIRSKAQDWKYTTLFALLGGGELLTEYDSAFSGDLNLSSVRGGILKSTGSGEITKLTLSRGSLGLQNLGTMKIKVQDGAATLSNFKLTGPNILIELKGEQFSSENLDLAIEGNTDLRILQIFVPFFEDLAGVSSLKVQTSGTLFKPEVLGHATIRDAYAKLTQFPHPFEKVEADVQFSRSRILIPRLRGFVAGGALSAQGELEIKGPRQLPITVSAVLDNPQLNVPDRFRTQGRAELNLSGRWFPYTLSGTYRINGGLIDSEFVSAGSSQALRQSSYLPQVILQSAFEPINLDLVALIERPLAIKNSLIVGNVTGQMQIKGTPSSPVLGGNIEIEKGSKLFFRETPFDIDSGQVQFKNTKQIDPQLYLAARTRKNDFDVSLLVQGTATNPLLRLSSLPPLSETDIVSLLALGITSQGLERRIESAEQETNTLNTLGTAIIANNPLTKSLQQQLGVNLQFSSQYDDTKNIAVQKITVSRQLTQRIQASASRLRGQQNSTEVKLQYQINPNVSAVGSWEAREPNEVTGDVSETQRTTEGSIFGLDLEFRREFK
jgi:translocation and assembly module TamB